MPEVDVKQEVPAGSPGPGKWTRLEGELAGSRAS